MKIKTIIAHHGSVTNFVAAPNNIVKINKSGIAGITGISVKKTTGRKRTAQIEAMMM